MASKSGLSKPHSSNGISSSVSETVGSRDHKLRRLQCCVQLPSDAEIIMATLKMRRREQTAVPCPPSTYAQDVASITSHSGAAIVYICPMYCMLQWYILSHAYTHLLPDAPVFNPNAVLKVAKVKAL